MIAVRRRAASALAALAAAAMCASACTVGGPQHSASPKVLDSGLPPAATPSLPGYPGAYPAPDPNRPRIMLRFDVSDDLRTVDGTEHVLFHPDRAIGELVFRLTANTPSSYAAGNGISIGRVSVGGHGQASRLRRAGAAAASPGGLLVLPLVPPVAAGASVTADVRFTLHLGNGGFDRFGNANGISWWGSGQPLLAWERGYGWHVEPLGQIIGETATSEAADIDVTVVAPAAAAVFGTGHFRAARAAGGRRTWHAAAPTARDVAVAVGKLTSRTRIVGSTSVTAASYDPAELGSMLTTEDRAIGLLSARFGPFPFPSIDLISLPERGGGIEYPGAVLLAGIGEAVLTHETAHQWFYGMVGDSQARDPWLDEAFAQYAQQLVDGTLGTGYQDDPLPVGRSMQQWGTNVAAYFATVYGKGAAMLGAARGAAGSSKWDAAVRGYVRAEAWRIARPGDLVRALSGLPAAVAILHAGGAVS